MNRIPTFEPCVRLDHVTKVFGPGEGRTVAVNDVSMQAFRGEFLMLFGPSGSGKTTLLTLIAGLLSPTSGSVALFGQDIGLYPAGQLQALRAQRVGFVFQTFHLIDALSALENVALVLQFAGRSKSESRCHAWELLRRLGIQHLGRKYPAMLSQGEKQRVAVARAIANDAALILADEPTASLDIARGLEIIRLLRRYAAEEEKCVIVASHDLRVLESADRVLKMENGVCVCHETAGYRSKRIQAFHN